jgi:hypothetical protein
VRITGTTTNSAKSNAATEKLCPAHGVVA